MARSGAVQVTAVPVRQSSPAAFRTLVASVQTGLSSRTETTSTRAVISSPTRTAFTKRHSTPRKTVPGPGSSSATTALSRPDVTPPCTISPPKGEAAASDSS